MFKKINVTNLLKSFGVGLLSFFILHFAMKWNISNYLISVCGGLVVLYFAYERFNGSNIVDFKK